jgi:hypothetical protein
MTQTYVDNRALCYTKNIHAGAEILESGNGFARVRMDDTAFSAELEIELNLPDLRIISIEGGITRSFVETCKKNDDILERAKGMQVSAGFIKRIKEMIGGGDGCNIFADMILEGCNAIIMGFAMEELERQLSAESDEAYLQVLRDMIENNPRVKSCMALKDGSPFRKEVGV